MSAAAPADRAEDDRYEAAPLLLLLLLLFAVS